MKPETIIGTCGHCGGAVVAAEGKLPARCMHCHAVSIKYGPVVPMVERRMLLRSGWGIMPKEFYDRTIDPAAGVKGEAKRP